MPLVLSVTRVAVTWLVLAVAMSANGIARELGLKRVLRPEAADLASALLGMALIGVTTGVGFRPLGQARASLGQLVLLSAVLVVATVGFETALGRLVDHKSWDELLQHYAIWRGELWPIVLVWLASMPFLWGRAGVGR